MLCRLFGKSRQAWYERQRYLSRMALEEEIILKSVKDLRAKVKHMGGRKLFHCLQVDEIFTRHQIKMGRDKFFDLLRENNLLVKRKRRKSKTTNSHHWLKKHPYLVDSIEVTKSELLWVSDITYLRLQTGFVYLSLITDAYSRKIMGYELHKSLETEGPLLALKLALKNRQFPERSLVHHSDRGVQYCSFAYVEKLQENNIRISMTQSGSPYENALAESINGTLKVDFDLEQIFDNYEQALHTVNQSIEHYNTVRPHGSINYLTPKKAHLKTGKLKNKWKKKQVVEKQSFVKKAQN